MEVLPNKCVMVVFHACGTVPIISEYTDVVEEVLSFVLRLSFSDLSIGCSRFPKSIVGDMQFHKPLLRFCGIDKSAVSRAVFLNQRLFVVIVVIVVIVVRGDETRHGIVDRLGVIFIIAAIFMRTVIFFVIRCTVFLCNYDIFEFNLKHNLNSIIKME
jgi:hypothetical protein